MRDSNQWLSQWVQESRRVLPLLQAWRDALTRRDLDAIDAIHNRLQPALQRLERLRAEMPTLSDALQSDTLQQALGVARAIDEVIQSAYDIILNELDYTHALIAMLTRAAEGEHYAPLNASRTSSTLLNTEV